MAAIMLLAAFGASRVVAWGDHSVPGFTHKGCSSIDLSRFEAPIVFDDGRITPELCQEACKGHHFAALLPDICRCGDDVDAINFTERDLCDWPCMDTPAFGSCGGAPQHDGFGIANIYESSELFHQEPLPSAAVEPDVKVTLPAPAQATEYPAVHTPCPDEAVPTLVTSVKPVPEPIPSSTYVEEFKETVVPQLQTSCTEDLVNEKPTTFPETTLVIKSQFSSQFSATLAPRPPTYSQRQPVSEQQFTQQYGYPVGQASSTIGAVVLETTSEGPSVPAGPQTTAPIIVSPPSQVPENAAARTFVSCIKVAGVLAVVAILL